MKRRTLENDGNVLSLPHVANHHHKELRLFELKYGSFHSLTDLPPNEMLIVLEKILRRILLESAISVASSVKWQAAYMVCFEVCRSEEGVIDTFSLVETVLKEETPRIAKLLHPSILRAFASNFSRQTRSELLFCFWILNQIGKYIPVEIKLLIFTHNLSFDLRRGCYTVLAACSSLGRKRNRYESLHWWRNEVIERHLPLKVEAPPLPSEASLVVRWFDDVVSTVPCQGYFEWLLKCCGCDFVILLPKRFSDRDMITRVLSGNTVIKKYRNVPNHVKQLGDLFELALYFDVKEIIDKYCSKIVSVADGPSQ
jgi:hypothetical protein